MIVGQRIEVVRVMVFMGGPEVMKDWLNSTIVPIECVNGGRLYYTNENYSYKYGSQTLDTILPQSGSHYIYYSDYPNQNEVCITHAAMEMHYSSILTYWNRRDFDPIPPQNNIAIDFDVTHVATYHYGVPGTPYMWKVTVHHGKPNCTNTDPIH